MDTATDALIRAQLADLGLGAEDEPVGEDAVGDALHVLVGEVVAAVQHRPGAGEGAAGCAGGCDADRPFLQ